MGREIKRVAAGFDWPIDETWDGFICPFHPAKCERCEGTGSSDAARFFFEQWYGTSPFSPSSTGSTPFGSSDFDSQWMHHLSPADVTALIKGNRLYDLTHIFVVGKGWVPDPSKKTPSAREVNEWSIHGFRHDAINCWLCVQARCEREGIERKCSACGGSGEDPSDAETSAKHESWQRVEPPSGDWWQVWETVSEGSPVTPAFATADELIDYLVEKGDAWDQKRGHPGWKYESAKAFVESGWAPSAMVVNGKYHESKDAALAMNAEA